MSTKKPSNMTDEELADEFVRLEEEKRAIKQRQSEINAQQELRAAAKNLGPEARRIIAIHVGGGITPEGDVTGEPS